MSDTNTLRPQKYVYLKLESTQVERASHWTSF